MTAEAAVVLPALVLVTVVLADVGRIAAVELSSQDAAAVGARTAARGGTDNQVRTAVLSVAPGGASVVVRRSADLVRVRVTTPARGPGPLAALLPGMHVSAEAVAAAEPVADGVP